MNYQHSMKYATLGLAALTAALATSSTEAATLYDSNGFEPATFVAGSLVGQDGWSRFKTTGTGNTTADVHTSLSGSPIKSGLQSITVTRDGDDGAGSTGFFRSLTGGHQQVVKLAFDLYVPTAADQDPSPTAESFGPAFIIEAYATGSKRIAGVGVDAADGSLYTIVDNSPSTPSFSSPAQIQLDTWQKWEFLYDFSGNAYYVIVDGSLLNSGGTPFLETIDYAGGDRLTDASIVATPSDQNYFNIEGEAYYDNYILTDGVIVPEPASATLALLAAGGLVLRRRR